MGGITGKITELRFVRCGTEGFKGKEFDYTIEGIGAVYRGADHSAYGFETDGVISNVRAFTPTRAEEKGLRHRVLIRRASTMEWFLGETARRWMHLKAGAINGFAARALTLREKAVTLRGKEA
ncbi:hypothetical protein JW905_02450, partial [bacterium]|nr:hypothetical protein [candidate division CSSED10-310 bacterium]